MLHLWFESEWSQQCACNYWLYTTNLLISIALQGLNSFIYKSLAFCCFKLSCMWAWIRLVMYFHELLKIKRKVHRHWNMLKWCWRCECFVVNKSRNNRTFFKIENLRFFSKLWWLQLHILYQIKGPIIIFHLKGHARKLKCVNYKICWKNMIFAKKCLFKAWKYT